MSRLSLRTRFTALTGLTVLVTGALLLVGAYLLAAYIMDRNLPPRVSVYAVDDLDGGQPAQVPARSTLVLEDGTRLTVDEYKAEIAAIDRAIAEQFQRQRTRTLNSLVLYGAVALIGAVGLATASSWWLAGRQLRRLYEMTGTAHQIANSPGQLGQRVDVGGPADEVRALSTAFNTMLERLDRAFDAQRRFVANASHELRTPLAINRAVIDIALDVPRVAPSTTKLGRTLLEVNARHEQLIEAMLTLAASEEAITERTVTDLADVAAFVLNEHLHQAGEAGIQVRFEPQPAPTSGDPVLLERLVDNLVANGIRHNHSGGWIAVATFVDGNAAVIEMSNTGPVVPDHEVESLLDPFHRLGAGPGEAGQRGDRGFGLGLSIVRAVARAHHGDVSLRPRDGGGLLVRVTLPLA